jgi:hypothetical protein
MSAQAAACGGHVDEAALAFHSPFHFTQPTEKLKAQI